MKKSKSSVQKYVTYLIILAIIAGLGYSLYVYQQSGAAEEGIIVCSQDGSLCYWQAHIHALIIPLVCGEERILPTEVGELQEQHTHEEKNTIHWHSSIPYDKNKGKIIDESVLKLGKFFDSINVKFADSSLYEYSNGQACPDGSTGKLKMFVNKNNVWQQNFEFRDYVWGDKDVIYIAFDSRSDGKVLDLLRNSRISFPTLGFG